MNYLKIKNINFCLQDKNSHTHYRYICSVTGIIYDNRESRNHLVSQSFIVHY